MKTIGNISNEKRALSSFIRDRLLPVTILQILALGILLLAGANLYGSTEEVSTYSASMNKEIKAMVVTPDAYSKNKVYPVVYLLHGYSGNYKDWTSRVPAIQDYANLYDFIIVCPDGNFSSWYFDSPLEPDWKYETYVARELTAWVDEHYSTIAAREGRAITGLSMGGHGALYLSFRNQDVFGAAGSMSGGVDIRPFPLNWELAKHLGPYDEYRDNWEKNTVINLVYLLEPGSLKLIIDCGSEDFFYEVNCRLHDELAYRNIPHDFISRPGKHNWEYWSNAIGYQALFFHNFFMVTTAKNTSK